MSADPTQTDSDTYKVIFENDRVRVLEYKDRPGDRTSPHRHPDSVMYTLSSFERRLIHGDQHRDVQLRTGRVNRLSAQEHIGTADSHVIFVALKESPPDSSQSSSAELGPTHGSYHDAAACRCRFATRAGSAVSGSVPAVVRC